jgi:serralysin
LPAVSSVSPSGISYIDWLEGGLKWASGNLTYSFPTSASFYGSGYGSGEQNNNFMAFNAVQQAATTSILNMYSQVANVTFTQIAETSTQSATLRYAGSGQPSTAWGYYPSTWPEGGDAWFNSTGSWYTNPVLGNYGYLTIIHETGHLLGLKHPQDVSGSFGAAPVSADSLEYTVMSYRSYIGASTTQGLTNATWSFPQTLMMYDIAALQYMYSANYTTNSGDTVYKWNPATGQETINGVAQTALGGNTVFMTVWDGGGNDTYDFSNYTINVAVNLQPGGWTTTSSAQLANLGAGHTAIGNIANAYMFNNNPASLIENAVGGTGSDSLTGNTANNKLTGGAGNDTLDGVNGTDTAVYSGAATSYQVTQNADGSWKVVDLRAGSPDGTDTLRNIDFLQFSDTTLAVGAGQPPPPPTVTIESYGSTSLTQVGTHFYLYNSAGSGPSLKVNNADVTAGQYGNWTPLGAEQTATGYEVVWKNSTADQYIVWNTNSSGNWVSQSATVNGANSVVTTAETVLHQDFNGDGVIGGAGQTPATIVSGTDGDDVLMSTAANEVLFGNGGHDTFVFAGNFGKDTVADFYAENDVLEFNRTAFADVADVLAHSAQVGTDVTVTVDATDSVTLNDTTLAQLNAHNAFHLV